MQGVDFTKRVTATDHPILESTAGEDMELACVTSSMIWLHMVTPRAVLLRGMIVQGFGDTRIDLVTVLNTTHVAP